MTPTNGSVYRKTSPNLESAVVAPIGTELHGPRTAVLDEAHLGDIRGALGTLKYDDVAPRTT